MTYIIMYDSDHKTPSAVAKGISRVPRCGAHLEVSASTLLRRRQNVSSACFSHSRIFHISDSSWI